MQQYDTVNAWIQRKFRTGTPTSTSTPSRSSPRESDEPVRLTRIYTRGGDAGETSLGDGSRVSKLDPLVRAFGAVDELNSLVGWAQVAARDGRLERIQNELFDLGADLCVPYAEGDEPLLREQAEWALARIRERA